MSIFGIIVDVQDAQDNKLADSLEKQYNNTDFRDVLSDFRKSGNQFLVAVGRNGGGVIAGICAEIAHAKIAFYKVNQILEESGDHASWRMNHHVMEYVLFSE